jgi:hypothetical protein
MKSVMVEDVNSDSDAEGGVVEVANDGSFDMSSSESKAAAKAAGESASATDGLPALDPNISPEDLATEKEAGNQQFRQGNYREALRHYVKCMGAQDLQVRSPLSRTHTRSLARRLF